MLSKRMENKQKVKIMKRGFKVAFILIIFLMSGFLNVNAQGRMRGFRGDSITMKNDSLRMHMPGRNQGGFHGMMPGMSPAMRGRSNMWMGPGMRRRGMNNPWMGERMRPGAGMMNNAPGRRIMESIPGITQKQKDELGKLNDQHQSEMKKLIEQNQQTMKQLREDHRKKVMNLLTDEQKKWLEEHTQNSQNN